MRAIPHPDGSPGLRSRRGSAVWTVPALGVILALLSHAPSHGHSIQEPGDNRAPVLADPDATLIVPEDQAAVALWAAGDRDFETCDEGTLSWTVIGEPEGAITECQGTVLILTWDYGPEWVGQAVTVGAYATDHHGASSDTGWVTFDILPMVEIAAIEVTQGLQDWASTTPLFAGKETHVRVHVQKPPAMRSGQEIVNLVLHGSRNGAPLPGSPLDSTVFPGVPTTENASLDPVRRDVFRSAHFVLPESWTDPGTVELTVEPVDRRILACNEDPSPPGDCRILATFDSFSRLALEIVVVPWSKRGVRRTLGQTDVDDLRERLLAMYPTPGLDGSERIRRLRWRGKVPPSPAGVNLRLRKLRVRGDGCRTSSGCETIYYGAIPSFSLAGGEVLGRPDLSSARIASGYARRKTAGRGRTTHAHEIGHALGLQHVVHDENGDASVCTRTVNGVPQAQVVYNSAVCPSGYTPVMNLKQGYCEFVNRGVYTRELARDTAPNWLDNTQPGAPNGPYLGPFGPLPFDLYYGFDISAYHEGLDPVASPYQYGDVMSYCLGGDLEKWVGIQHFFDLYQAIEQRFPAPAAGASEPPVPRAAGGEAGTLSTTYLMLRGEMDLATGDYRFADFFTLDSPVPPETHPVGDFTLAVVDALDNPLAVVDFEPDFVLGPDGSLGAHFQVPVPADPAIRRAVLLDSTGAVLTDRTASPSGPSVQVLYPNGGERLLLDTATFSWSAMDADGDPLTYDVDFSSDAGASWRSLAVDWPLTSLDVERDELTATTQGLLRVRASDGFLASSDTSDAPFEIGGRPPRIVISSPREGALFVHGQTVPLQAAVNGGGETAQMRWESDLSGLLAFGPAAGIPASSLPAGFHTLTARAAVPSGWQGQVSVQVRVAATPPGALADLGIQKTGDEAVFVGQTVSYLLTVGNGGPDEATGVQVVDDLPAGMTPLSATASVGGCSLAASQVICDIAVLAVGDTATVDIQAMAAGSGVLTNTALVQALQDDPLLANNSASHALLADPNLPAPVVDADGDGHDPGSDCDDTDSQVHPGASEICNGLDDDCNGLIDEGGDVLCDDGNACTVATCGGPAGCQVSTPGLDDDLDGHLDPACGGDDCQDTDPGAWNLPWELAGLSVSETTLTQVAWSDEAGAFGTGTGYDVVGGLVTSPGTLVLAASQCLQSGSSPTYSESRPDPEAGQAYWYLVQAENGCGAGGYGTPERDTTVAACP